MGVKENPMRNVVNVLSAGLVTGTVLAQWPASAAAPAPFPLVELRQYTLHPGQREAMIDLFEREFVESQEALGMKVIGTFRDLDNPDRFVWLRGFRDMASRAAGLDAFYSGPVWQRHRAAANATMVDSDNVLLLRAPDAAATFAAQPPRAPVGAALRGGGIIVATLYHLPGEPDEAAAFFAAELAPRLREAGIQILAHFVRETSANNFPNLPIRENERVFVWFSRYESPAEHRRQSAAVTGSSRWAEIVPRLDAMLARPPEILRLAPAARSELR